MEHVMTKEEFREAILRDQRKRKLEKLEKERKIRFDVSCYYRDRGVRLLRDRTLVRKRGR